MSEEYKRILEAQLWNIANTLRGKMNADEFRDYILGFIFYKYLSEKMNIFADEILKQDGIKFKDITPKTENGKEFIEAIKEEALEKLGYFLRPEELFTEVAKRGKGDNEDDVDKFDESKTNFILEDLQKILINIQLSTMGTESEEDYENLFEDMDLNSSKLGKTPEARNAIIAKVLTHLDKIDFKLNDIKEVDVLGDAYEYLIGQFASGAGKKAGEFYTPQQVSSILAKLVTTGKQKLKSVYDPTCGSGSLLLRVAREVEDVSNFYGQEMNRTTYNLARMNMILHGVHYRQFDIKQDDTLEHPQHIDKQFEAIVANPPFSAKWSANPLFTSDDRFSQYGKLAPSSKADFAFVQHMIYHLAENGTMAIVLPHGALFRGGAEQQIRKYLIENKNFLDAVIGLPANIFYGTSIPTCILVFKKCRENPDDVLFIDASSDFERVKTQNILLKEHIDKIISTFRNRTEVEKYSKKISLMDIAKNDYNLNIPRYIVTFEAEDNINIDLTCKLLIEFDEKLTKADQKINEICSELNLPQPKGTNLSLLITYKKGIMQKLFSQELRFSDESGNEFPEWDEKKLGEVTEITIGEFVIKTKQNPNGKYPVYNGGKSYTGFYDEFNNEGNKIIISARGANAGFVNFARSRYWAGNSCYSVSIIDNSKYDINYFYQFIKLYENNFIQNQQAANIPSVSKKDAENFIIQIPSIEEQLKISNFLSALDEKINAIQDDVEKTEVWNKV